MAYKTRILDKCPPLYILLCTGKYEYQGYKRTMGFFYGIFLGLCFYELILVDLDFTENAALIVTTILCLMLAFGIAFSSQIRCIVSLTYPCFAGKVGRAVLKALVLTFIISGPINNLTNNGKEVVRVFACTTSLTFNMTKTRFELMFKPFTAALFGMKTEVNEVKDTIRSIKDVSAPIAGEIENENEMKKLKEENDYIDTKLGDTKRSFEMETKYNTSKGEQIEAEKYQKRYMEKIELRCEDQFTRAAIKCRNMFAKGYDVCYDTVTWVAAWLLCWPMKIDFVCNIAESLGGASRCDPSKIVDPGLGEGYTYLKHSRESFSSNFKNVRLQYKIGRIKYLRDIRDARDTAASILHTVNAKKKLIDDVLRILKRILAFVFLKILFACQKYHDQYLRDIHFDNIYISRYFRKIDARRKYQEKKTLLPLKKIERKKLVDPNSLFPLKSEREQFLKQTLRLLLEMITATTFVLLDRLFYEALDLVRRHARIDYLQTGRHDLKLEVKGTGMIASLIKSIVKGFNVKKRIRIEQNNRKCLPRPNLLPNYYLYKIYGFYFVVWLMILLQAYTQRLRRIICAYFYRKREKQRVLFLYNETLKRRIGFFRFMKKKVKKLARENHLKHNLNVCMVLRTKYPEKFECLRFFTMARRKCLICEDPEPRNRDTKEFVICPNENCHFLYCLECWNDMGGTCLACLVDESDVSSDESVIDFAGKALD